MRRFLLRPPLAGVLFSFALAGVAPAAPAPPADPAAASPSQATRERLARPVTLSLRQQSLRAAMDALREAAKVNITLDSVAIQQQLGFTPEQPPASVSIDVKDVPARTVLRRVLDLYGLAYAVVGDSVVVSTEEGAAARQMGQRIEVHLDNVELAAALRQTAHDAGVNLALDPRVEKEASAKVSLHAEDVTLETAVRLLAEMAGLKPLRVGNVLFVTTKATAAEMRQDAPAPPPDASGKRLGDIDSFLAPPAPIVAPAPPPGVPPAVLPAEGGDRK